MKLRRFCILFAAAAVFLSACSLLPYEEDLSVKQVSFPRETIQYESVLCARKDMDLRVTLELRYLVGSIKQLNFSEPLPFGRNYVKVGSEVTKGELLCEQDTEEFEKRLTEIDERLAELAEEELSARDSYDMSMKRVNQNYRMQYDAKQSRIREIEYTYNRSLTIIENERTLLYEEQALLAEQIEARRIYAPFDGIIQAVNDFAPKAPTNVATAAVRIMKKEADRQIFTTNTVYWKFFPAGMTVPVTLHGETYEAKVLTEKEAGRPETLHSEGNTGQVIFVLTEPVVITDTSEKATLDLTVETRENALTVPSEAIHNGRDASYVYVLTDSNVRELRQVETGIFTDEETEIVSGLSDGERVILDRDSQTTATGTVQFKVEEVSK